MQRDVGKEPLVALETSQPVHCERDFRAVRGVCRCVLGNKALFWALAQVLATAGSSLMARVPMVNSRRRGFASISEL